jgi:hypothetical protein
MPSPNAVFTELVTTTFRNHRKEVVDAVSKHNALYRLLAKGKRVRTESGGTSIAIPLEYAENSTYQRYSGLDLLNIQQSDVLSAAEFPWRQIAIHVVASGYELRVNNGPEKIANLAKSRVRNAMNTFANNFSADMYSDGSLANQIGGMQALVSDAGTGVVGGIDSTPWTFWRSKVQSAAAPIQGGGAITPSATTIESLMLPLYIELTRGNDYTDLIVASNNYYTFFEQSQTSLKRYMDEDEVMAGFLAMRYKNAKVVFDGNSGMAASRMYFLNTNHLELVAHTDANLTVVEDQRPVHQDGSVTPVLWMGNMVTSNRALQGVLKA